MMIYKRLFILVGFFLLGAAIGTNGLGGFRLRVAETAVPTPTSESRLCPLVEPGCEPVAEGAEAVSKTGEASGESARVRVVLFWMEGCPRCDEVIQEVMPPLYEEYGSELYVKAIEIEDLAEVEKLYQMGERLGLSKSDIGVPILLMGNRVLVGSDSIRGQLPGLVKRGMKPGVDYPVVPEFGIEPVLGISPAGTADFARRWGTLVGVALGVIGLLGISAWSIWKRRQ